MRQVLVTGADGFIGSHLTEALLAKGFKVRALALYNSFNNWGWLEGIHHPDLNVVTGDIRDPDLCREIVKGSDTIFHLAALIAIPFSYHAPQSYVDTNIKGTLNMCQAAREYGAKVLITSTSEVYGTAKYVPIDELHPRQPQSPYSASKIASDALALSFYHSFNLPVVIVRPFNTYGPRQSARAIIPTIISQIAAGKESIELGDLAPTRDFNYVKDVCQGFIKLSEAEQAIGQEVNICSNSEISVEETFKIISKLMGSNVTISSNKERRRPINSEVYRLFGDNRKIKEFIDYVPSYGFEEGLNETIKWFTNADNLKRYKVDIYNV